MKKLLILLAAICLAAVGYAQPTATNTAFHNGENVKYVLKFNWGPVWVNVGHAEWKVTPGNYDGQRVHKVSLRTSTNKRADKVFVMRDTMTTYVSTNLVPLFFDKRGVEGKNKHIETIKYSYPGGQCSLASTYQYGNGKVSTNKYSGAMYAYDMVSMMLRARSYDATNWQVGHRETFMMAEGKRCSKQAIVYRGKKNISVEGEGGKYRCLVFSYLETDKDSGKGKEKEIVKFYITDDANHLPVRLDMNLSFGSAKAFMTSCSGVRNPLTSKLK